jgi:D-alanyl-D-alanine carboxypeptidase
VIARRLAIALSAAAVAAGTVGEPRLLGSAPLTVETELQLALEHWAVDADHYGVSASVVFADGRRWSGAAGHAGSERLRPDHLIQIGSITKTMTGAVILQLVDDGVLRLDDPVGRWLDPLPNVDPAITIRQLLNHTAGVANYTGTAGLAAALASDWMRVLTPVELLAFVGAPLFPPGEETFYTNTSFLLLGQIAERAAERSIVELYRARLWAPLGLTDVFLPGYEEPPGPVAIALTAAGLVDPLQRPAALSVGHSAFGLLATASTVAAWGHALFEGTVVSEEAQLAMRALAPAAGNIAGETGAGLGIRGYAFNGRTQYGHSGAAIFGSSLLLHDPGTRTTVAVVMNQGAGADHFVLAPQLLQIATDRLPR